MPRPFYMFCVIRFLFSVSIWHTPNKTRVWIKLVGDKRDKDNCEGNHESFWSAFSEKQMMGRPVSVSRQRFHHRFCAARDPINALLGSFANAYNPYLKILRLNLRGDSNEKQTLGLSGLRLKNKGNCKGSGMLYEDVFLVRRLLHYRNDMFIYQKTISFAALSAQI